MHPIHAILIASAFPLFLAALISDVAYWTTAHVQWINFSSWLIAGGLLVSAVALFWKCIELMLRKAARVTRVGVYVGALLLSWGLGFVNALIHARDAWGTMPEGLYLSIVVVLAAFATAWIGLSRPTGRT